MQPNFLHYIIISCNLILSVRATLRQSFDVVLLLQGLRHVRGCQDRQKFRRRNFASRRAVGLDDAKDDFGDVGRLEAVDGVHVDPDVWPVSKCRSLTVQKINDKILCWPFIAKMK